MNSRRYWIVFLGLTALLLLSARATALAAWPQSPLINLPVCTAPGTQVQMQSAPDGLGGVILAWADGRPGMAGICMQRVSCEGVALWTPDGVRVFTSAPGVLDTGFVQEPNLAIVADGAGGAIIAWKDSAGPGDTNIRAQRVNRLGSILWDPAGVPVCQATGQQIYPKLVADGEGGAIVAWQDDRDDYATVYAQHVNASGECTWMLDGVRASDVFEDLQHAGWISLGLRAVADDEGGVVLAWSSTRGLVGQRLDSGGIPLWSASGNVVCSHRRTESTVAIVPDGSHGAFFAWTDYRNSGGDVYAQRVDGMGTALWAFDGVVVIGGGFDSWLPQLAPDAGGGCIVLWMDTRPYACGPCNGSFIMGQRLDGGGHLLWPATGVVVSDPTRGSGSVNMRTWHQVIPDGSGGVFFTYMLNVVGGSLGPFDIYAQRVAGDGTRAWSNDVAVCTIVSTQMYPTIVGAPGGAIVAWNDERNGNWDIYADRVGPESPCPNRPPDCSAAYASVAELWPPNHEFMNVQVLGVTDPDGDPISLTLTGVTQDEPTDEVGDGNTCPDATISGTTAMLRAERTGNSHVPGNGRVYQVSFMVTDGNGGSCEGSVNVCVPHDQRPGHVCIDDGQLYNALACDETSALPPHIYVDPFRPVILPGRVSGDMVTIAYTLPGESEVRLSVFDLMGRKLATFERGPRAAGAHEATWHAAGVKGGIYFVRLEAGGTAVSRSVLILR